MCAGCEERSANIFEESIMIQLAVIGVGHWGPNHIRNFSVLAGGNVKYAVDLDNDRLATISRMFPHVRTLSSYATALDDQEVDAVVIVTPTDTHYTITKQALM